MDLKKFKDTLENENPPANISNELKALWYDSKDEWNKAHEMVQENPSKNAAWVHAYLHRKEGDEGNADYWYRRAQKEFSKLSLQNEWDEIVFYLLSE